MVCTAVRGYRIGYEIEGNGTPVLFLHGLGADRRQSMNALHAAQCIRLVAPDMPGHGESLWDEATLETDPPGFSAFADVALDLLDQLGVRRCIVGGTSMGAGIALAMVLRKPNVVDGLFLVRPAWLNRPAHPHLALVARLGNLVGKIGPEAARCVAYGWPEVQAMQTANPEAAAALLDLSSGPRAITIAPVLAAMIEDRPFAAFKELSRLRCPTVIVGNDHDPLHPPDLARKLASEIPNARYVHVPSRYNSPGAYQQALATELGAFQTELKLQ